MFSAMIYQFIGYITFKKCRTILISDKKKCPKFLSVRNIYSRVKSSFRLSFKGEF